MQFPGVECGGVFRAVLALMALILWPTGSFASEAEIIRNVQHYAEVVFGSRAPALADYQRLQGPEGKAEFALELKECERSWGVSIYEKCGEAVMDKRCEKWISQRSAQPSGSESLYFRLLRQHARPAAIEIVEIRQPAAPGEPYTVAARSAAGQQLEFSVVAQPPAAASSPVSLASINGKPVEEILEAAKSAYR